MPLSRKLAIKITIEYGFVSIRQKGSHEHFIKDGHGVTIPYKKEFPIGTARAMIKTIAEANNISIQTIMTKFQIKF